MVQQQQQQQCCETAERDREQRKQTHSGGEEGGDLSDERKAKVGNTSCSLEDSVVRGVEKELLELKMQLKAKVHVYYTIFVVLCLHKNIRIMLGTD